MDNTRQAVMASTASEFLGPTVAAHWANFVALLGMGRRREAFDAADTFVDAALLTDEDDQKQYVEAVARRILDAAIEETAWVRGAVPYPVVARMLLPRLRAGRSESRPSYARWLGLTLSLDAAANPGLRRDLPAPRDLLDEAIAVDSGDAIAMRAWVEVTVNGLEYDFHELPIGLLSPPAEILEDLDRLELRVARLGEGPAFRARIAFWRSHAVAYGDYLKNLDAWDNYSVLMDARGLNARP